MKPILTLTAFIFAGCASQPANLVPYHAVRNPSDALTYAVAHLDYPDHLFAFVSNESHSMRPAIEGGDIVLTHTYSGEVLRPGQIVIFDRGDYPRVCHRVIEFNGRAAYLAGDDNLWPDGWYAKDRIRWVVDEIVSTARSK